MACRCLLRKLFIELADLCLNFMRKHKVYFHYTSSKYYFKSGRDNLVADHNFDTAADVEQ
jgi:hypothetical protein